MHILVFNWRDPKNPKSGGAELVTMEHAKQWVKKGYKVTWFTSMFKNAKKEEKINGVNFIRKGNSIATYFFAPQFYFLSKETYDIVVDEIHGIPYFTPLFVKKPKIAFIHEIAGVIWDYMYPFPINILGRLLEKYYFKFYKHVFFWTDAESTKRELSVFGINEKNITVIPCPATNKSLTHLPNKEKKPTYIFVSRLVKMKGVEGVINAFENIVQKQKNAELWIVGGGGNSYVKDLKTIVRKKHLTKQVNFFGKVDEKKKLELMRKAHILLHASVKEGWGLVVLEAASQATPAVVYDVGGLRDSVQHDKTGIVVEENTPQDLANEAMKLFENTKKYKVFQKNCLYWSKSFTWGKSTTQSLQLLEKTLLS